MVQKDEGTVGKLPKELVGADCPKCGFKVSQDTEVTFQREDNFFVGYTLQCPRCATKFSYTLF